MRNLLILCSFSCFLLAAIDGRADTLVTKDGRVFEGRLISKGDDTITFEIQKFGSKINMTFKASEVASITEEAKSDTPGAGEKPAPRRRRPPNPNAENCRRAAPRRSREFRARRIAWCRFRAKSERK